MAQQQSLRFLANNLRRCCGCCWCRYFVSLAAGADHYYQYHRQNQFAVDGDAGDDDGDKVDQFFHFDRNVPLFAATTRTTKKIAEQRSAVPVPVADGPTRTMMTTTEKRLQVADRKSRSSMGNGTFSFAATRGQSNVTGAGDFERTKLSRPRVAFFFNFRFPLNRFCEFFQQVG